VSEINYNNWSIYC